MLWHIIHLDLWWPTCSPWTTCGPLALTVWPSSYFPLIFYNEFCRKKYQMRHEQFLKGGCREHTFGSIDFSNNCYSMPHNLWQSHCCMSASSDEFGCVGILVWTHLSEPVWKLSPILGQSSAALPVLAQWLIVCAAAWQVKNRPHIIDLGQHPVRLAQIGSD